MIVTGHWESVGFPDAEVSHVTYADGQLIFYLEDVALLPDHPGNMTAKTMYLDKALLIFERVASLSVHAYLSDIDIWQRLDKPYPYMSRISDVVIEDGPIWRVTGFDKTNPRWLEWTIRLEREVRLEA